jgi:selenium metabolism protein YedF
MSTTIDARGMVCPKPVMMTKKALDTDSDCTVIVDNETASKNVSMFASARGCTVSIDKQSEMLFSIHIIRNAELPVQCEDMSEHISGPTVFVFSSNIMGRGDDSLGTILMKAFIHTTTELNSLPDTIVFYNTGVKLVASDSETVSDIKTLEDKGVKVLVCGTCINYFNLSGNTGAGTISNMYDILNALNGAGRIINP